MNPVTFISRFAVFLAALAVSFLPLTGRAANPAGDLRIEVMAAYNLVVDSNVESPSTYAPRAAYMGAKFYNDGANPLTNVTAYIGNYLGGTNDTPGLYPRRAHPPLVGPLPGSQFALTHEGGASGATDATRYLGTIQPGESVVVYWLVSYPNVDANGDAVWGPSVKPEDDLWLQFDIWGRAQDAGVPVTADVTRTVTMRNEISAMANKIFPNSANKVPQAYQDLLQLYAPAWTNTADNGAPGTRIVTEGVWYDLGNVGAGFDNNGDLVPDRNAWMQPVGDASLFDPSCFRLVRTRALVVVLLNDGTEQVIVTEDQLYFENIPDNNRGAVGYVAYEFEVLRGGCSSGMTPYQEVASGFDNEKFNGDYGATLGQPLVSAPASAAMGKTASRDSIFPGSNIVYTVTFTNTGALPLGNPSFGTPLVVQDRVPPGTFYVSGSAASNQVLPSGVSDIERFFSSDFGTNWVSTEPVPATNVTDIQWWLSDALPVGGAGAVGFAVTVRNPYTPTNPVIANTAGLSFGNSYPFTNATASTLVLGNNSLGDTVYLDEGSGFSFGNGQQDAGEPGRSNVTVHLYYDTNANGVQDAGDSLLATAVTGTNGTYSFTQLPDGFFLAVVDVDDPDVPAGYTPTTPTTIAVALDPTRATTSPVTNTTADFGFAPALTLDKSGSTALREGQTVTYAIVVTNRLRGNGTGLGQFTTYDIWATNEATALSGATAQKKWINPSNLWSPSGPDGLSANPALANADEDVGTTGFRLSTQPGSVTNVHLLLPMSTNGLAFRAADSVTVNLYATTDNTRLLFTTNYVCSTITNGTYVINVTAATNWSWGSFNSTNRLAVQLRGNKGTGSSPGGILYVDAVGLRVTSDVLSGASSGTTTLDPVPLTDTYDADLLQLVSASPSATSATTTGAAPNTVGTLAWDNVGPLYAGGATTLSVTFRVREPTNNTSAVHTNVAAVTAATFANGRPANSATDTVVSAISPAGTIGDFVWRDLDGDGVQDGGSETGISGVSVVLTPPAGVDIGTGPGGSITNVTDASGFYLFTSLPSNGTYTVAVLTNSLPGGGGTNTFDRDGNRNNSTPVTLTVTSTNGADTVLNADFGYRVQTAIDGTIWHDLDRSGTPTPDAGEDWLAGITVYLCAGASPCGAGGAVATNTTSSSGFFRFAGSYTGSFTVSVNTNTGPLASGSWTRSFDTDGLTTSNAVTVNVVSGGTARADFSYYKTGAFSIGDTLYYDWDGDGGQDTNDEGIASISVDLYEDSNANGVVDLGQDAYIGTAVTGSSGTYLFQNMPASNYLVVVDQADTQFPPLYVNTADPYGARDGRSLAIVTNASRLDQDFGYQPYGTGAIGDTIWRDLDGNGLQSGAGESGISNVTVTLLADFNGDGTFVQVATTSSDGSGLYRFANLPDGSYRVQVSTTDPDLPDDAFGTPYVPTTPTTVSVSLAGGTTVLTADFGFAALGAIGDTIFWDVNQNGTQDYTEPGATGVTVQLYLDVNTNGLYDAGTDSLYASDVTDAAGQYLFSGLTAARYVVVVVEAGPLSGAARSADPSADGLPCGDPEATGCDGAYGVTVLPGGNFMGADFGYVPPGVIGDTLWIDTDNDGVRDVGESGIPYVTVQLFTNGTLVATGATDSDGIYSFSNLRDGTYRVVISTNDADFPAGLSAVYDPDGALDGQGSSIVVSNGVVAGIGGTPCTDCDLSVDFGYRYAGTNALSGTVGLDAAPYDGRLGAGASGVGAGESPFPGETVYLYLWNDDGDNVVESGETAAISSTSTATNGDYAFSGLPSGDGNDRYIVSLAAPQDALRLTTTNGATPATSVVETQNLQGYTVSAYQVVPIAAAITGVDFAFRSVLTYDYGDLPAIYGTLLGGTPEAARHEIGATTNLYLGATADTENNGAPSVAADGDGADEDGVALRGVWQNDGTGTVQVTVGAGAGWLVGYVDFNGDGDFLDVGEFIIDEAVTSAGGGLYTNTFPIATNAIVATNATRLYARFRLFDAEPPFAELAFAGDADNGEVEDYRFELGAIGDLVWVDLDGDGVRDPSEQALAGVRVFIDQNGDGLYQVAEPAATTDATGAYGIGGLSAGSYTACIDTNTLPAGLSASFDLDGTNTAHAAAFALSAGQVRTDVDFGYRGTAALTGDVRLDTDADGNFSDPDAGIPVVTVSLYSDPNGDGDPADGVLLATTLTDAAGAFVFTNLVATNYVLVETDRSGYSSTADTDGANDNRIAASVTAGAVSTGHVFLDTRLITLESYRSNYVVVTNRYTRDPEDTGQPEEIIYEGGSNYVANAHYDVAYFDRDGHLVYTDTSAYTTNTGFLYSVNPNTNDAVTYGIWTAVVLPDGTPPEATLAGQLAQPSAIISDPFEVVSWSTTVFTDATGTPMSGAAYTNQYGTSNGTGVVYMRTIDRDQNQDTNAIESITVTLTNAATGDSESVTLYETGPDTGVFAHSLSGQRLAYPISTTTGGGLNDGTLRFDIGDTLQVLYTDPNDPLDQSGAVASTAVIVSTFTATRVTDGVLVEWSTASEDGTAGFYLLRREADGWVSVNRELTAALPPAPAGAAYAQLDRAAPGDGAVTYLLVEQELRGARNTYGPYTINPQRAPAALAKALRTTTALDRHGALRAADPRPARQAAARRLRAARATAAVAPLARRTPAAPVSAVAPLRIEIEASQVYALTPAAIAAAAGMASDVVSAGLAKGQLRLTHRGADVAWAAAHGQVVFFAEAYGDRYTATNVFWLERGNQTAWGLRKDRAPSAGAGMSYSTTRTFEENHVAPVGALVNADEPIWMWDYIQAGNAVAGTKRFAFNLDALAPATRPVQLVLHLTGTTKTAANPDHHVRAAVNGQVVGEARWDGIGAYTLDLAFAQSLLREGANELELTGILDPGRAFSIFYLDNFAVTYTRRYQAVDGTLDCSPGGNAVITADGFRSADITVLEVGNWKRPVRLDGTRVEAAGGGYRISFKSSPADVRYYLFESGTVRAPAAVVSRALPDLRGAQNRADYVIVTPQAFVATARTLAQHRAAQGMSTSVLAVEDVYDVFNYGMPNPEAIRSLLRQGTQTWSRAPRYCLIAGAGTYDHRGFLGYGDSLIPPLMVSTPVGVLPSDEELGNVVGDGTPEVIVGRLPVLSDVELARAIGKTIAYEQGLARPGLMAADNRDASGNFPGDSHSLAQRVGSAPGVRTLDLQAGQTTAFRSELFAQLREGRRLLNWTGHGGISQLANEGVLKASDVPALNNAAAPTLVVGLTCLIGQFAIPGVDTLGQVLVTDANGAAAVWAPAGMAFHLESMILGRGFYEAYASAAPVRLGDAVRAGHQAYARQGHLDHMHRLYNLLGDPALALNAAAASGAGSGAARAGASRLSRALAATAHAQALGGALAPGADVFVAEQPVELQLGQPEFDGAGNSEGELIELSFRQPSAALISGYGVELGTNLMEDAWRDISDRIVYSERIPLAEGAEAVTLQVRLPVGQRAAFLRVRTQP
ncbi:MAG: hypothetical protein K8T26_10245 [Lentisphaerae bacterium]|nr:hypothetical protein [Lentisphaerota bacterium]